MIGMFLTGFILGFIDRLPVLCIFILFPCFLIGFIFKRKKKLILKIGSIVVVSLALLVALNDEINYQKNQFSASSFTPQEKARLDQIVQGVGQNNPDFLTQSIHDEYWSILDKNNNVTANDAKLIEMQSTKINKYMTLFYEDALRSYKTGTPYKSEERNNYEKTLVSSNVFTSYNIDQNDKELEKIALKQNVTISGNSIVFNEDLINAALDNIKTSNARYDKLYTK